LNQHVQHDAVLVDGAPEIMLLTGDLEHHLIEMPFVARPGQPSADDGGELLAKLESPLPDRLMADLDAAEGQHLLDHPKAQRESKVQPHRVADQLRREAVAGVEGLGRARHAGLIPHPPAILNLHEPIKNKLFLDRTRKDSNFKHPHICATLFQIEKCCPPTLLTQPAPPPT
jgi:hypothetical protein